MRTTTMDAGCATRYELRDVDGTPVAVHVRRDRPGGKKSFAWERPDGSPGLSGRPVVDLPLFGVHLLRDRPADPVIVVEGEKAAQVLQNAGLLAVGTVTGAAATPSVESLRPLVGRDVLLWPDADASGSGHMVRIVAQLQALGVTPRWIEWPDAPLGGDAADFVDEHGPGMALERILDEARPVEATPAGRVDGKVHVLPEDGRDARRMRGFPLTDLGNAERLVAHHGPDLRYDHVADAWFGWDGRHWGKDTDGEAHRRAKSTVRSIYGEAQTAGDEKTRQAIATWALRSEAAGRVEAMLSLASSEREVAVTSTVWDADPWALNCLNGTLDLRTGTVRAHRREDLITKLAPVAYDPDERSDLWEQTLEWALPDPAVRAFYQRAVGYSLTGDTREDKLFFVRGPTAALKSTVNEAIKSALGDYAMTADFETFLKRRDVGGPRNDIARLAGARFVLSIEVEQGRRLAEGLIKMLTGGDTVAARFLFHEAFEFRPTFTLWLVANHAPKVPDDDDALWRRIVRIPFEHVLPKEARDPTVKAALRDPQTAGAAILAWAVEGCLAWQRDGLRVPPIIEAATEIYRADMDPLADFFEGYCVFGPQASVAAADLRAAYETWARDNGDRPLTGKDFATRLRARGCTADRTRRARLWHGIELAAAAGDTMTPGDGSFDNLHRNLLHEGTLSNLASPAVTRHQSPADGDWIVAGVAVSNPSERGEEDGEAPLPPLAEAARHLFNGEIISTRPTPAVGPPDDGRRGLDDETPLTPEELAKGGGRGQFVLRIGEATAWHPYPYRPGRSIAAGKTAWLTFVRNNPVEELERATAAMHTDPALTGRAP